MSLSLARATAVWLKQLGVSDVVICAGARNAPLIKEVTEEQGFAVYRFFEEREAGFFALGLSRKGHESKAQPVAVITTSGTAVAELLPASVEAYYQGLPLIWVTADRPQKYRGSGAPQSIEQIGIFSHYVECSLDWSKEEQKVPEFYSWSAPLHLNICFDEPLLTTSAPIEEIPLPLMEAAALGPLNLIESQAGETKTSPTKLSEVARFKKPLIVLGPLNTIEREIVRRHTPTTLSVFAESLSGLKHVYSGLNQLPDSFFREGLRQGVWDAVIRIGDVPTHRLWRDLESLSLPVLNFSSKPWQGLSRSSHPVFSVESLAQFSFQDFLNPTDQGGVQLVRAKAMSLMGRYPASEVSLIRQMGDRLRAEDLVYLGNSLPIREFEWSEPRAEKIFGNRGANGIDGQISTFIGLAQEQGRNYGFFGDLTTLYGLASPWALNQKKVEHLQIVVINNNGGMIFNEMFKDHRFFNSHQMHFQAWAEMWGLRYQQLSSVANWDDSLSPAVIELCPSATESAEMAAELYL